MFEQFEENFSLEKDKVLTDGMVKIVYDDGFKTNIIFCADVSIRMYGKDGFVIMKEVKGNKKQIIPLTRIVRIQYIDDKNIKIEERE